MASSARIEGLDSVLRALEGSKENVRKMCRRALRDACKPVLRDMRKAVPSRWRRLIKSKVAEGKLSGGDYAMMGMFNNHAQNGHQPKGGAVDDWFKAYWSNYGTLRHRDPNHDFATPVRHAATAAAKGRRNNEGQEAQGFFNDDVSAYIDRFMEAFEESMKKQENSIF